MQNELVTIQPQTQLVTPMDLIVRALESNWDIDKLDRLIGMKNAEDERHAKSLFEAALIACQEEIKTIVPDSVNEQTKSKYAKFATIDKAIRPIYIKHGFSISYNSEDIGNQEMLVKGIVSHIGGYTREYCIPISRDPSGPKGGGVMTRPQGTGNAMSYARRYILGMVFNLAIGEDNDGNSDNIQDILNEIRACNSLDALELAWVAFKAVRNQFNVKEQKAIIEAKDARKKELSA